MPKSGSGGLHEAGMGNPFALLLGLESLRSRTPVGAVQALLAGPRVLLLWAAFQRVGGAGHCMREADRSGQGFAGATL